MHVDITFSESMLQTELPENASWLFTKDAAAHDIASSVWIGPSELRLVSVPVAIPTFLVVIELLNQDPGLLSSLHKPALVFETPNFY